MAGERGEGLLHVVGHLDQLVTQSMLTVRRQELRTWYGQLDTLRAFAVARLVERDELAAVQDRWLDALVDTARDTQRALDANAPGSWRTLHTVQADLRAAARRCLDRDSRPDRVLDLLRPLAITVHSAPAAPVAELAEAVLARWSDDPVPDAGGTREPDVVDAAAVAAFARLALHENERAAGLARRALAARPTVFAGIVARRTLIVCDLSAGRPELALRWTDELLALADAESRPGWPVEVGALRAVVLAALDRPDEAMAQARTAVEMAVRCGTPTLEAWAGLQHACLLALRDPTRAGDELAALVGRCQDAGYPLGEGAACRARGALAVVAGQIAVAAAWLGRALDVFVRIGHLAQMQVTLRWVAALALVSDRPAPAAALRRAAGNVRAPVTEILDRAWLDELLDGAEDGGGALPLHEAVALARRELAAVAGADTSRSTGTATGTAPTPAAPAPARFVLEGSVWTMSFAGRTVRLPAAKGLTVLATLLARPGREVSCTELAGAAVEQPDTGEVLDAQAQRRYEARIVELQDDLGEAEERGDRGRAEAASLELDLLVEQLTAARGLGGRTRRSGGSAERARTAVTWRIRSAIKRIDAVHPDLGRHLRVAVRTGSWCSYRPEHPVAWELTPAGAASTA